MPAADPPPRDNLRRRLAQRLTRLALGREADIAGTPLPATGIHHILVVRTSHSLGNTLLLTPLLQELEAVYPGAEIDVVSRSPVVREVYGHYPCVRRILTVPSGRIRHLPVHLERLRQLRATEYDLAIDSDPQSQSARLVLGVARARYKLGYVSEKKSAGLTHGMPVPDHVRHKGMLPVHLLRMATGAITEGGFPPPDIRLDATEREWGRQRLEALVAADNSAGRSGAVGVFANATGHKALPREWWDAFMTSLEPLRRRHHVVEILPASGRSMLGDRFPAYYSTDIRRLGAVLGALTQFICLDCGVMHLGCAAGAPVRAIFTTTPAEDWGPYGPGGLAIEAGDLGPADVARHILERSGVTGTATTRRVPDPSSRRITASGT
ncbi:MAG TPA: glycosyltransferase family 9 protein [Gammaproteobacteria bacterium]|nr:glycosyltransferase family 9 protein [Gammaproteobacteria bacterium]